MHWLNRQVSPRYQPVGASSGQVSRSRSGRPKMPRKTANIDKKDFFIPPVALFYFYTGFAAAV
jgi:hypothetical protein